MWAAKRPSVTEWVRMASDAPPATLNPCKVRWPRVRHGGGTLLGAPFLIGRVQQRPGFPFDPRGNLEACFCQIP